MALLETLLWSVSYAIVVFSSLFVVMFALEKYSGADMSRYRTRNFATDVIYGFFYQGGFYNVLVWAPLAALLEPYVSFARVGLLDDVPFPLAYAGYWLGMDFLGYWMHRLQHSNRVLWQFHSIHHSQRRMTFITTNRLHLFDIIFANLFVLVPVTALGVPSGIWMPLYFVFQFQEYVQHAELPWRYGPFYRVVVSPVFHAIHHDRARERYDRNLGKALSIWDFAFGTADSGPRPTRYGVAGLNLLENPLRHFVVPFQRLVDGRRQPSDSTP